MIILDKSKQLCGQDYAAYFINFLANSLWVLGLLEGTEDKRINSIYMGMLRGFGVLLFSWLLAQCYNIRIDFPDSRDLRILNVRNFFMTVHGFCFAISFHYLEAPVVYTIANTGAIFVFVLDYLLNGAGVTQKQLAGIFSASIGIVLAVNSHVIYRWWGWEDNTSSSFDYVPASTEVKLIVALLFLLAMIGWAYAILLTRRLQRSNAVQVNFHQGIMLLSCNSLALLAVPTPARLQVTQQLGLFLKVGVLMSVSSGLYVASVCMTKKSGNVTIIGFLTVVMGYGISMIRYGQTPNIAGVVGSVFIGIGLLLVLIK